MTLRLSVTENVLVPYADPEKRKEGSRLRAERSRLRKKLEALQTGQPPARKPARKQQQSAPAEIDAESKAEAPGETTLEPVEIPTKDDWARMKVQLGLRIVKQAEHMVARNTLAVAQVLKLGVDLVNANLPLLPEVSRDNVLAGSVGALDDGYLREDPEFRRLAEALLIRKMELQLAKQVE